MPSDLNPADCPSRGRALENFDAVSAAKGWLDAQAGDKLSAIGASSSSQVIPSTLANNERIGWEPIRAGLMRWKTWWCGRAAW